MNEKDQVTKKFIADFTAAWNERDIDHLMSFMAKDCIFMASVGHQIEGALWEGWDAVKEGFESLWEQYPDAHFQPVGEDFIAGNRGVAEWIFTGTRKSDGSKVKARGCDVFTFKDGKILVKNSMRKQKP